MNAVKYISVLFIILIFTGCFADPFHPDNKNIIQSKKNGEFYRAPYRTYLVIVDDKLKRTLKRHYPILSCNIGDGFWKSEEFIGRFKSKPSRLTGNEARERLIGCVRPLSNKSLRYYSSKKNKKSVADSMNDLANSINRETQRMKNNRTYQIQNNNTKSGCASDYECGLGNRCVKASYNVRGTCRKSVNSSGIQQFNAPRSNFGANMNPQCTFTTDCPIGFSCNQGNCVK